MLTREQIESQAFDLLLALDILGDRDRLPVLLAFCGRKRTAAELASATGLEEEFVERALKVLVKSGVVGREVGQKQRRGGKVNDPRTFYVTASLEGDILNEAQRLLYRWRNQRGWHSRR